MYGAERAILVLRHYIGYEPSEIADVLGQPAGTVRSRLHHAHRAMRAAIDADDRAAVGGSPA
jgi:RNA polymerase sigma-70 factor (ECF subfamily)